MEKIEIVQFPKKCPHCGSVLKKIVKMSTEWLECQECFIDSTDEETGRVFPGEGRYIFAYRSR